MIALGLYAGIQVALRDAPRRGINKDQLMNVALLAAVLGIVGYRTNGWGFEYTNPNTFGPLNTPVQPASLYELLISLALFLVLWNLRTRIHPEGMLAMIYLVLYSISQFFIFFVRDNIVILGGLKQAQVTALVVIALTLPVIAYLLRKERLNPPREEQAAATPTSTATEVAG